jgi:NADH-quinone oxidoreductase subunit N
MNYAELFRITLPETALEVAALLVLVVDLGFLRKAARGVRTAMATALGVLGCLTALWLMQGQGSMRFTADLTPNTLLLVTGGYTAVAQAAVLVLTAVTLLLLIGTTFTPHVGEFVAVVLMSATGGLLICGAQDLLVIFTGLELLSLGLYVLTAFAKSSGNSAEAALKYYLFGGMSAAFLLFGFSLLYGVTGSTNLEQIATASIQMSAAGARPLLYVALVMVSAGLGFKVAAVPFQLWAPDTYQGAPAPAAGFIASVSKVASFALLISVSMAVVNVFGGAHRVFLVQVGQAPSPRYVGIQQPWSLILVIMAAASMLAGNLAALAQSSVRRLLAYSAIAHAGYILLALAYFSPSSFSANAVLYYIVTYGLTTIGAFGVIDVVERVTGSDRMDAFLGLHKRSPLLAAVLLVLFLSLAGIPPLVGFWAKFNLFAAVLGVSDGVVPFTLVALAVGMSAVSLYYYLQVLKRAYVMPAADDTPIRVHPVTALVLFAIAAAVVVLGCFPGLLQDWIATCNPVR